MSNKSSAWRWRFSVKTAIRAQGVNYENTNPAGFTVKDPAEKETRIRQALKDIFGIG